MWPHYQVSITNKKWEKNDISLKRKDMKKNKSKKVTKIKSRKKVRF